MFYWPYKFRRQTVHLVPKSSGAAWLPQVKSCVNGNEVSIRVPRNKNRLHIKTINPRRVLTLRNNDFNRYVADKPEWEYFPLVARWLDFNGPWFTGTLGGLGVFVGVLRQLHSHPDVSLFHPRAFEATVSDLLRFYHGGSPYFDKTLQNWYAPVGWKPLEDFSCVAVKFDAITNPDVGRPERHRYLVLPISDQYLLQVALPITRVLPFVSSSEEPEDDTDQWISEEPMKALADQILESLQVRLSPEAERQQAKALERLSEEERKLVKEFPPLKWA